MADITILLPHHMKMLEASAIDPKVAEARGYRSIGTQADLKRLGFSDVQRIVPTLLIPIWSVNGTVGLYHHRPDTPRVRDGRLVKYEFPAGRHMVVDVHPFLKEKVRDPRIPLFITEGVKKADAAISAGICCIAVVGTWNWRGTNEYGGKTALPDWDGIALKDRNNIGRQVIICYDSDVMLKPQVYQALVRLSDLLKSRGANVAYAYLPHGDDGNKTGLDDYLASGHSKDDLLSLKTHELRKPEDRDEDPAPTPYRETPAGIVWDRATRDGIVPTLLTNFKARIVVDGLEDDGAEKRRTYEIEASLNGKQERFTVPAVAFPTLNWASERLGVSAIVEPGFGLRDRARAAIQSFSHEAEKRTVYTHIGWRRIQGRWTYLHGGRAIGTEPGEHVSVRVQTALGRYVLPEPPQGTDLTVVVHASLGMLDLGNDIVVIPLFAALFRSVLGPADYSLHLTGQTGVYKSEIAALAQQHFGAEMDARHLPTDWSSTDNFLEAIAFTAKDAILTIDDLFPRGSGIEVQKLWSKVDRVLRGQGNNSGRGRMRADGTLPPPKPPRGTIVSTGEEIPPGQSLNARMFVLEVGDGDIRTDKLTACQKNAIDGLYAGCMAGFIDWLAPRYDEILQNLKSETCSLRDHAIRKGQHRRTSGIVADLVIGYQYFVRFAADIGAITVSEANDLNKRAWDAILTAAEQQACNHIATEPTELCLRLLSEAIASGRAHLATLDGTAPPEPFAWGWRYINGSDRFGNEVVWREQGDRIGWIDGSDVYLLPAVAYQCARRIGGETGDGLSIQLRTLNKRLRDRGLLASHGGNRGTVIRKVAEGRRQDVLHFSSCQLVHEETAQSAHPAREPAESLAGRPDWRHSGQETCVVPDSTEETTAQIIGPYRGSQPCTNDENGQVGPFGPFAIDTASAELDAVDANTSSSA